MKTYNITLYIGLVLMIFWFGCGEGEEPDVILTKKDLLIQSWQLSKFTANGTEQPIAGYSIRFNDNNSYSVSGPLFGIPSSGTWSFNSEENRVLLNGGSFFFFIDTLTETNMVLRLEQENYKSGVVSFRFELTRR